MLLQGVSSNMITASVTTLGTLILTILPALFAGRLSSQAYKIRVILNNKLLLEKGKHSHYWEVKLFNNLFYYSVGDDRDFVPSGTRPSASQVM